jgi:hypothetical protein
MSECTELYLVQCGISSVVRVLPVVVIIPQQGRVVAGEGAVDPGVPVADTPDRDSDALGDVQAGASDEFVIPLLLSELVAVNGLRNTDVELSDGDIEASLAEADELLFEACEVSNNEVGLRADTVDGGSTGAETLDEGELRDRVQTLEADIGSLYTHSGVDLGTGVVQVVVVDIELSGGIDSAGGAEGDINKLLTKNAVEDAVPELSIVLEDLIYDILHDPHR